jgi:hypothetical protein
MPGGRRQFEFVDKQPLVFQVVATLLFVNTFLFLSLSFGAKYFLPKASVNRRPCEALAWNGVQYHAPQIVCWYASRSIAIQFILLAMAVAVLIIFRRQVRYIPRK